MEVKADNKPDNKHLDENSHTYLEQVYRIYEFDDGLYFPDVKFRCGNLENYVKTGILSESEVEEIWKENATLR